MCITKYLTKLRFLRWLGALFGIVCLGITGPILLFPLYLRFVGYDPHYAQVIQDKLEARFYALSPSPPFIPTVVTRNYGAEILCLPQVDLNQKKYYDIVNEVVAEETQMRKVIKVQCRQVASQIE